MNNPGNFVSRWSRLKRQSSEEENKRGSESAAAGDSANARDAVRTPGGVAETEKAPEFDVSILPPIDEITAGTDIRAFLQSGVPAELAKAALRKVWTADPAIRDFIGLAENQWDFTNPASIPGFGPLQPTDNVSELVARAMGTLDDVTKDTETAEKADAPRQHDPLGVQAGLEDRAIPQSVVPQEANSDPVEKTAAVEQEENRTFAVLHHAEPAAEPATARSSPAHGRALPR